MSYTHPSVYHDPLVVEFRRKRRREQRLRKKERQRALFEKSRNWVQDIIPPEQQVSEDVGDNPYYMPQVLELGPANNHEEEPVNWDAFREAPEPASEEEPDPSHMECQPLGQPDEMVPAPKPSLSPEADGKFFPTRRPLDSVLRREYDKGQELVKFCTPTRQHPKNHIVTKNLNKPRLIQTYAQCVDARQDLVPKLEKYKFCTVDTEANLKAYDFEKEDTILGDVCLLIIGVPPHDVAIYDLVALKGEGFRRMFGRLYDMLTDGDVYVLGIAIHEDIRKMDFISNVVDIRGQFYLDICTRVVTSPNNPGVPRTGMKHLAYTLLGHTHACYYPVPWISKYRKKLENQVRRHRELYGDDLDPDNLPNSRNMKLMYQWGRKLHFNQLWYLYLDAITPLVFVYKHAMRLLEKCEVDRKNLTFEGACLEALSKMKKARPPPNLGSRDLYVTAHYSQALADKNTLNTSTTSSETAKPRHVKPLVELKPGSRKVFLKTSDIPATAITPEEPVAGDEPMPVVDGPMDLKRPGKVPNRTSPTISRSLRPFSLMPRLPRGCNYCPMDNTEHLCEKKYCFYPFCNEQKTHGIAKCAVLQGACARCRCRGHTESQCSESLKKRQIFHRVFSRYADQGAYTVLRKHHPEWDFYCYENKRQIPSERPSTWEGYERERKIAKRRGEDVDRLNREKEKIYADLKKEKRRRYYKKIKDLKRVVKQSESVTSAGRGSGGF